MVDIYGFLVAVLDHWIGLMSGIVALVFAIWLDRTKRASIPSKVFWGIGILCIFGAFYQTWKDEHVARLKADDGPRLVGELSAFFEFGPGELDGGPVVAVLMKIRNLGTPSSADAYRVSFKLGNAERTMDIVVGDSQEKVVTTLKSRGYRSTAMDVALPLHFPAIQRGETLSGYILVTTGELTKTEFEQGELTVGFRDVLGQRHFASGSYRTMAKLGP